MVLRRIRRLFQGHSSDYLPEFSTLFTKFQQILEGNNAVLETIAQMEDKLSGEYIFDINYILSSCEEMSETVYRIIYALNVLSNNRYANLFSRYETIQQAITRTIEGKKSPSSGRLVIPNHEAGVDMEELVGSKSARLGEVRNRLDLSTPDGFTITTAAYDLFMKSNRLWPQIREILDKAKSQDLSLAEQSARIADLFDKAVIPPNLEREINQASALFSKRLGRKASLAVRSSAWGEDSEDRSFAGQFRTLLNQSQANLLSAYKMVLASRFSETVLAYDDGQGEMEDELPMAVTCQEMLPAKVSGIAYTVDPAKGSWDRELITAVYGLGEPAVSGMADMDQYHVSRFHPFDILDRRISVKETQLVITQNGEIDREAVPKHQHELPCLSDEQVLNLAQAAMALERYFRRPQDIEWAIDAEDNLVILQVRPLTLHDYKAGKTFSLSEALKKYPVLISNEGQVVQRGLAAGRVVQVLEDDDPTDFPQGAIAVTRYTSPRLTKIIRKTTAIITDVGSPTGHMATIAREFGVPAIVGSGRATELLKTGMEITVDAEENKIYDGVVPEVLEYQIQGRDQFSHLREFKILRKILRKVAPLNLLDPTSPEFTIENCLTYHDILRFCHEKAVWELINLQTSGKRFRNVKSRELKLSIPIGLHIIDTGDGLASDVGENVVDSIDQVNSIPMRAILQGLMLPGTWDTEARALSFDDFMSSLTRFSLTSPQPQFSGRNLAVISDHYTNLSLRLGYHFNVIDTYVSDNINDNYVYFRFVGGVTEPDRRHRRGLLIQKILEKYDFKVVLKNDLVIARLKKRGQSELHETLVMIGKLIGFTRQLDTAMISDESIERHAASFLGSDIDGSE